MLFTLIAAAAAVATPAPKLSPEAVANICAVSFDEKQAAKRHGDNPVSFLIPTLEEKLGMSIEAQHALERSCQMFDDGALFATIRLTGKNPDAVAVNPDEDELAPDYSDEPVLRRP